MVYFVRKYSRAKWGDIDSLEEYNIDLDSIPSDAYTSCLRTNNNKLSIWKISWDDNDELDTYVGSQDEDNYYKIGLEIEASEYQK